MKEIAKALSNKFMRDASVEAIKQYHDYTMTGKLVVRFILQAKEESVSVLKAWHDYIANEKVKNSLLPIALIGLVTALFSPLLELKEFSNIFTDLENGEFFTRLSFSMFLGIIFFFFTYFAKFPGSLRSVLLPLSLLFGGSSIWFVPTELLKKLIDTSAKRDNLLLLTTIALTMICYLVFWELLEFLAKKFSFFQRFSKRYSGYRLIEELSKKVIADANEVKSEELAAILRNETPGKYQSILANLNQQPLEAITIQKEGHGPNVKPKNHELGVYLGITEMGQYLHVDLAELPHLLIGGATGGGKSNFQNHLISELLPKEVELNLIDPEQVEFFEYRNFANVKLVGDIATAKNLLKEQIKYMEAAKDLFTSHGVKKLTQYNQLPGVEKIKRKVIIFDEFASFSDDKELIKDIVQIARLGRKWGVHLVIGTQRPSADVVVPAIRNNLPTSLAFRVRDKANSKILNVEGADVIGKDQKGLAVYGNIGDQVFVQTPEFKGLKNPPPTRRAPKLMIQADGKDIVDQVVAVLKKAGKPLYTKEIATAINWKSTNIKLGMKLSATTHKNLTKLSSDGFGSRYRYSER